MSGAGVERPDGGDLSRRLYLSDTEIGGDSTIFHAINRAKESLAIDLKNEADLTALKALLAKADVLIQNFRPGVIQRLGLDYEAVKAINPKIVYASISGYGEEGPWVKRPGQDRTSGTRTRPSKKRHPLSTSPWSPSNSPWSLM